MADEMTYKGLPAEQLEQTASDWPQIPLGVGYDPARLDALELSVGFDGLQAILVALETDRPRMVNGLRDAVTRNDAKAVRYFAHSIKSNAQLFGAAALAGHCQALEQACILGNLDAAISRATIAAEAFEALVIELLAARGRSEQLR